MFRLGENDVRVGLAQALEMHRALKANGMPTALEIAPRGRLWLEPRHQLFKGNVELAWLERYVTKAAVRLGNGSRSNSYGDATP